MVKILNLNALRSKLLKLKKKYGPKKPVVIVGYEGVNYAIYVHENLEARHTAPRRAKFLEAPARTKSKQIAEIIEGALSVGATLEQALILGGERLQRESQKLVPVKTGNLRGSAFTRVER